MSYAQHVEQTKPDVKQTKFGQPYKRDQNTTYGPTNGFYHYYRSQIGTVSVRLEALYRQDGLQDGQNWTGTSDEKELKIEKN